MERGGYGNRGGGYSNRGGGRGGRTQYDSGSGQGRSSGSDSGSGQGDYGGRFGSRGGRYGNPNESGSGQGRGGYRGGGYSGSPNESGRGRGGGYSGNPNETSSGRGRGGYSGGGYSGNPSETGSGRGRGGYSGGGYSGNPNESGRGRGGSDRGGRRGTGGGRSSGQGSYDSVNDQMRSLQVSEGAEMQSSEIVRPSPVSTQQSKDKILPIKRPDTGSSSIKPARLLVNHFPVKYDPNSTIFHYDIDIKLATPPKSGRVVKIPKYNLCMIRDKLFADHSKDLFISKSAYDGNKNIFSAVALRTGTFTVDFAKTEDMRFYSYTVIVTLVNELKLRKLKDYISGGTTMPIPRDILQGMDIVMKEDPSKYMISVGRSFYPTDKGIDLGFGIEASTGFQQSLKPTTNGLALILDSSVLAFRKPISVIEYLYENVRGFDIERNFRNRDVEVALKGLKVTVTHRKTKQKFLVAGLTRSMTREVSFTLEDPDGKVEPKKTMLVNYFREKYEREIKYQNIPCLDLGKLGRTNAVPMELCVIAEGQRFPKESLAKNSAKMLKDISLPPPNDRMNLIRKMVKDTYGGPGGEVIRNFGMDVAMNMTSMVGRVIAPPLLKIGGPGKLNPNGEKCHWNLTGGNHFVDGKSMSRWGLIDFTEYERYDRLNRDDFIDALTRRCGHLHLQMAQPSFVKTARMTVFSNVNELRALLNSVKSDWPDIQLVMIAMSRRDNGYKTLKWIAETQIGMVTQCFLSMVANKPNGLDQYLANLALKMNAKLGGSNVELFDRLPHFERDTSVMFIGADVNHPASKNITSPSIAAVVASMNFPAVSRYAAKIQPQQHRTEKILNFGQLCLDHVRTYACMNNNTRPQKIVVFRDGVSEGQFDMVLNEELEDMKSVFASKKYFPTITLIVAQKRHPTRLFLDEGRGPVKNVSPGTVVDKNIVHPSEFDFYLCSHAGLLGTSKPTHYHVLYDQHNFSADQLQKLIFHLCFTFARCTKSVSLVPPVYYADLAAYRGRMYYEAWLEGGQPQQSIAKLHGELESYMFFI